MEEVIRVEDQFYILATSATGVERNQVLKQGETFAVFDRHGNILPLGLGEQGVYHEGTRFLSRLELKLGDSRPLLLSSTVRDDNDLLAVDMTNPDIASGGEVLLPRGTLHFFRSQFLWEGACYDRVRITNHGLHPVEVAVAWRFEADFRDIFEIRGVQRERRGEHLEEVVEDDTVGLFYRGLDGVVRKSRLEFKPSPENLSVSEARFRIRLEPKKNAILGLTVSCEVEPAVVKPLSHEEAFHRSSSALAQVKGRLARIRTTSEQFNRWLTRSVADTHMMISEMATGPYPYAGIPWFSTVFGRDGIITALELLWLDPTLARGVLSYLAATQARAVDPEEDAEPGKIIHEVRLGEMAALKEIPFGRYYGTVDATPLFVLLAGAYHDRTGDLSFVASIWPQIELALQWMDTYGDPDRDGFIEYSKKSTKGLLHQGWKDSQDSIFHEDGSLAEGPIALCEVQAYAYAAKVKAAFLASLLGRRERGESLLRQAQALQDQFERKFWCEELSTYVLALDGSKRPCRVRTSNAGHCLFAGIAGVERARRVARTLLDQSSHSGWGIRTVAITESRYNPMSYHNGSVWPHDNALIAMGMARYGLRDEAHQAISGLLDAPSFLPLHRLPELFCGFSRRAGEGPTLYPVACAPQAWASGAVFLFLQTMLGLNIRGPERKIHFLHPALPDFLEEVEIRGLEVGNNRVDLLLQQKGRNLGIHVLEKAGDVEVVVVK